MIEILVVVFLIAITVYFVSVNLGRDVERLADLEAKRFSALVNHIREESVVTGQLLGVIVDDRANSYKFLTYRDGWQDAGDDDTLRERTLREGLSMRMNLGEAVEGTPAGLVMVEPMGSITPFKVQFEGGEAVFEVFVDDNDNVDIRIPGAGS